MDRSLKLSEVKACHVPLGPIRVRAHDTSPDWGDWPFVEDSECFAILLLFTESALDSR